MLGWLLNLGFAGGLLNAGTPPVSPVTRIQLLSNGGTPVVLIGRFEHVPFPYTFPITFDALSTTPTYTGGRVALDTFQVTQISFPYVFPLDFDQVTDARVYSGGKVKLLNG